MEQDNKQLANNPIEQNQFSAKVISTTSASTIKEPSKVDYNSRDYISFGTDNLFPQGLAILNRRSSTHRSILNNKVIYSLGRGFITENNSPLEDFLLSVNNRRESLRKVLKKLFNDWYSFGNAYLEIVLMPNGQPMMFFHKDATRARIHKDREHVIFHPDWKQYEGKRKYAKTLPLYPKFEKIDGFERSVFHFKQYEPEFCDYGIPEWVAALDAAAIGYKTNRWNLSRLENSFQVSGVLEIVGDMSAEDAKKVKEDLADNFSGEENVGKLLSITRQFGESGSGTTFTPLIQTSEGEWLSLHEQSDSDLIIAHNWFRSLSGISDSTGFDTKRIRNEYQVAKNTIIGENQDAILSEIIYLINEHSGIDANALKFRNESPVNLIDLIDVNSIITVNEARENSLGFGDLNELNEEGEDKGSKLITEIREESMLRGQQKRTSEQQKDGDTDN
jgi:hypothetical protein